MSPSAADASGVDASVIVVGDGGSPSPVGRLASPSKTLPAEAAGKRMLLNCKKF